MERIGTTRAMGAAVAQARKAKGITQDQLAREAGVSRQLVNRLEVGMASGIALATLLRILDLLGCSLLVDLGTNPDAWELPASEKAVGVQLEGSVDDMEFGSPYILDQSLFLRPDEGTSA